MTILKNWDFLFLRYICFKTAGGPLNPSGEVMRGFILQWPWDSFETAFMTRKFWRWN